MVELLILLSPSWLTFWENDPVKKQCDKEVARQQSSEIVTQYSSEAMKQWRKEVAKHLAMHAPVLAM